MLHKILLVIITLFATTTSFSHPKDNEKPLRLTANSSTFNYKTGIDVYKGNVKVNQGTTDLSADKIVTTKDSSHKISSIIAYGHKRLAEFSTIPDDSKEVLNAKSKIIEFYPKESKIVLKENVLVTQAGNSIQGSHIIYNIEQQIVSAPHIKNSRATIIIEQKAKKS